MALTKLTKDMDIIQKLGDEPNDVDGMTSAELKAKFDEGNNAMKQWVNDTFIPEVEKEIKASRLENLPEHAHTHAKDGRDPITPESIGARPDTWLPTPKEIGAAPAGYGLGENKGKTLTASDDLNAVNTIGAYQWGDDTSTPANTWGDAGNTDSYGVMEVVARSSTEFIQRARSFNSPANEVQRAISGSKVGEWEWVNPPMQLGVEYRTTERCEGKPVYAKRFNYKPTADFAANTTLAIPHGISDFSALVRIVVTQADGYVLPYYTRTGAHTGFRKIDASNVSIDTSVDWGKGAWKITMYYTKTTD
jgi:hypothetical protein